MPTSEHALRATLLTTKTFHDGRFSIGHRLYHAHPEEKCFHIHSQNGRSYKVRISPKSSLSCINELATLTLLSQRHVSWAADVIEHCEGDPSILVTSFSLGESLDKSLLWLPDSELIARKILQAIGEMHAILGASYGEVAQPTHKSWCDAMSIKFWHHINACIGYGLVARKEEDAVRRFYEAVKVELREISPRLLHFDIKPANVIFHTDTKTLSLVDFELARFGDSEFDWVKLDILSRRWPDYRTRIAEPLLERHKRIAQTESEDKRLLYRLYHEASIFPYERRLRIPHPPYRLLRWKSLLNDVQSRAG
jgi:aminoglycoside phosphotransferase (APT) family kinase protein